MYKALMCFGGADVRKIAKTVSVKDDNVMDNPYRAAIDALDNYYSPRMSLRYERFKFRQLQFNPKEKLDQFLIRLRTQAELCNFGEQTENMIMDQIVCATQHDDKLRAKYLEADTSLDDMLKIGRTYESVNKQVQEFRNTSSEPSELNIMNRASSVSTKSSSQNCSRCLRNHHSTDPSCPAKTSRCNKCNRIGHFARCCKGTWKSRVTKVKTVNNDRGLELERKPKFIREIDDVTKDVEIRELFHLEGKRTVAAVVGGVNLRFIVDTGADEDVLGIQDWNTLKRTGFKAFAIKKGSDKIFRAYGTRTPLVVLGEVEAEVEIGGTSCITTFFVIQDGRCSLLSGKTAEKLGVVKFLRAVTPAMSCIKGEVDNV
ncbi:uncharacterized protein LOC134284921 [Aedes albopictus]|uniref:Peptidase A2 domain-containing protein n=1 Tax=Aedes albopictus TaxID=7160 RepID=A0ABM1ZYI4_AEDAL